MTSAVSGFRSHNFQFPLQARSRLDDNASLQNACPDLAIVIPTYNERANIEELIQRIQFALDGYTWELLFVDDDSPDGTALAVTEYARHDSRVRLLQRIGRRGLSSACIEGMLATSARFVAVMDGDLQHDETILPEMLHKLREDSLDIVVGTRNGKGGSMGQFCRSRLLLSRIGQRASHVVCRCRLSDPMSGFFLLRRQFFLEVVRRLHGGGFKLLVDLLSSAERPVHIAEVGYTFRMRRYGESKLNVNTAVEYLFLIIDKVTSRAVPTRFVAFSLVGSAGVITHLLCSYVLLMHLHWHFAAAQLAATYIAMTENFFINNLVTWHDRTLRGNELLGGLISFWIVCSFGAWANVVCARAVLHDGFPWYIAGTLGVILSSVWNYSMATLFTWNESRQPIPPAEAVDGGTILLAEQTD